MAALIVGPAPHLPVKGVPAIKDTEPLTELWRTKGQTIAFSPNHKDVAVAGMRGQARILEAVTGSERFSCEGLKVHVDRLAFSPDGSRLAIGQMYDRVAICDTATGRLLGKGVFGDAKASHLEELSGLVYSVKTGDLLRSACKRAIDVIDPISAAAKEPLQPSNSTRSINAIAFFPDGDKLAAFWSSKGGRSQQITVWAWPERTLLARFNHPHEYVFDLAISPNGQMLAVPNTRAGIALLNATSGEPIGIAGSNRVYRLCFSPCGEYLIGSEKNQLCVWDLEGLKEIHRIAVCGGSSEVLSLAFSQDGRCLGTGTSRGVIVWRWKYS